MGKFLVDIQCHIKSSLKKNMVSILKIAFKEFGILPSTLQFLCCMLYMLVLLFHIE